MNSEDVSATAQVTLRWDEARPVDVTEVVIARWNGTEWEVVPGAATGDNNLGSITTSAATNEFGWFTLAELTLAPIAVDDQAATEKIPQWR